MEDAGSRASDVGPTPRTARHGAAALRGVRYLVPIAAAVLLLHLPLRAQEPPDFLTRMVDTERRFAARALVIGWKQAFLEFFADDAVGFDGGRAGSAREQVRANPDPPPDMQLLWEPRYGDAAASGELGYLTGPVRTVRPSAPVRHSVYFSVWKRQRNGSYAVVMDVGTTNPSPAPFADGFTAATRNSRFTGDYDETTPPLGTADSVLNSGLRVSPASAYRGRLATGVRVHRVGALPVVGERAVLTWAGRQPRYLAVDSRYAEAARSGDLGYTWGTYRLAPVGRGGKVEEGFYVRTWVRERNGQWKLAADVTQPQ